MATRKKNGSQTARPAAQVRLLLDHPAEAGETPPARDISAAARVGETLFLGADESAHVEILFGSADGFIEHRRAHLARAFDLPGGDEEMDIEGLTVDEDWLWVVGSHSLTRKKPKKGRPLDAAALRRMAKLKDNPNRLFLGRLPLMQGSGGRWDVWLGADAARRPQMLPIGKGGSELYRLIKKDPLLGPFCALPAKENGLDVEGVVVDGDRVALGLRGPVINGWAIVLEVRVQSQGPGALQLSGPLQMHFLDLGGLGIRDLKRRGDDVFVLTGPTLKLDGPAQVFRWRDWRRLGDVEDRLHRPERLLELPCGVGCDHPEALAPYSHDSADALLVVCDKPGSARLAPGGAMLADVFVLPNLSP